MADGFQTDIEGYWISKDPDAVLDYTIDWTAWLSGDTISSAVWAVPTGLVKDQQSETATAATVWLSGGTADAEYVVTCHIITAAGREEDRSFRIRGIER